MALYIEKPILVALEVDILPENQALFTDWQVKLSSSVIAIPEFTSLELLAPSEHQKDWIIVQRFATATSADAWRASEKFRELLAELKTFATNKQVKESAGGLCKKMALTEVILTDVHPGKLEEFKAWSTKIHHAEARFPGFRGFYLQQPEPGQGTHWITLLQFDTMENLDNWLQSPERLKLLDESKSLVSSHENRRIISPYAGWFSTLAKTGEMPSVWKQTMVILLILFPLVVLELKYLSPLLSSFNSAIGTFIGNALSVSLISYPMMPIAIRFLGWWLSPTHYCFSRSFYGTVFVLLLYLLEIAIFWDFL